MAKSKHAKKKTPVHLGTLAIVLAIVAAFAAATWATVLHTTRDDLSAKYDKEAAEKQLTEQLKHASGTPSPDLAVFLKQLDNQSGCDDSQPGTHSLRIEYKDFALIRYGCGNTDASMYLKRVDGQWKTISPTNQFHGGIPLCSMITEHSIPKILYGGGCFKPTDGKLPLVGQVVAAP